ncbi:hypothetical protein ROZALSC1DRAFT_24961, partial [Rozella allomycis CSF55]
SKEYQAVLNERKRDHELNSALKEEVENLEYELQKLKDKYKNMLEQKNDQNVLFEGEDKSKFRESIDLNLSNRENNILQMFYQRHPYLKNASIATIKQINVVTRKSFDCDTDSIEISESIISQYSEAMKTLKTVAEKESAERELQLKKSESQILELKQELERLAQEEEILKASLLNRQSLRKDCRSLWQKREELKSMRKETLELFLKTKKSIDCTTT